jgi:hypothetical protein
VSSSKRGPALRHHIFFWIREEVICFSAFAENEKYAYKRMADLIAQLPVGVKRGILTIEKFGVFLT